MFFNDRANLLQFVHQVFLVVQASGRIYDQNVECLFTGALESLEDDGSWIGSFRQSYYFYAGALCPDFQLRFGCGSECPVAGGEVFVRLAVEAFENAPPLR